ncbi:MAG TPA: nucleotide exchange factor GrpE [Acidimicrobiales bacterium]
MSDAQNDTAPPSDAAAPDPALRPSRPREGASSTERERAKAADGGVEPDVEVEVEVEGEAASGTAPETAAGDAEGATLAAESDEAAAQVELDIDLAASAVERERDEYLDALRRLQADFENYKKRMIRQQTETLERAAEHLVEKLLPVLDAIDLANQHGSGEAIAPVATALMDTLAKEGLERIDPVGEAFDPTEHEAVMHEPADPEADGDADEDAGQVVAALLRAGYRWRGRLVRAAMVSVRG